MRESRSSFTLGSRLCFSPLIYIPTDKLLSEEEAERERKLAEQKKEKKW